MPLLYRQEQAWLCTLSACLQEEARAKADAVAKAREEQKRKAEEARAAAVEAARKKQVNTRELNSCRVVLWCWIAEDQVQDE
jgi:membrane protein involved in colicin uptake